MAIVAVDAIMAELMDSLPNLPLAQRPTAIASAGEEMAPFLRPDDTAAPPA